MGTTKRLILEKTIYTTVSENMLSCFINEIQKLQIILLFVRYLNNIPIHNIQILYNFHGYCSYFRRG